MTAATLGGILLIISSWFTYKGNIYLSIILYFIADCCWLFLAFSAEDYMGAILVSIGMILGVIVFLKMNRGEFVKSLLRDNK